MTLELPPIPDPLPGPPGLPLLGHVVEYPKEPYRFCERAAREHGDVVKLDFAGHVVLLLSHPAHARLLLVDHNKRTRKDPVTRSMVAFLGEGLLTADNTPALRKQRRLSAALLGAKQVTRYGPAVLRQTHTWVSELRADQALDLHAELMGLALMIGAETLFGVSVHEEEDVAQLSEELEVFLTYFRAYGQGWKQVLPAWLPTPMRARLAQMLSRFDARLDRLIEARRAAGDDRDDVLGRLLHARDEEEGALSAQQLRDDAATLLLAGHETTALALGYTLLLLSQHPEALRRAQEELHAALGDAPVTPEAVGELPWLDAVIRESLRIYPPAWAVGREVLEPFSLGGLEVSPGTALMVSPWVIQRDPRWFTEPLAFRPERWLNGETEDLPRFAYFPFGGGGRVCVGMHFALLELRLCLAVLLQRAWFAFEPGFAPELTSGVTLRPIGGLPARVRLRG